MTSPHARKLHSLLFLLFLASPAAAQSITLDSLLAEMVERRALSEFPSPAYQSLQSSSRDPSSSSSTEAGWFANDDRGHFESYLERDGRREGVMLRAEGPGAVVRIWSANPEGTLRVYVDGAAEPVLAGPMREFLSAAGPVPSPLAARHGGGYELYLPIPFQAGCLVTCDEPDGLYYHVNHRRWPPGTPVTSFALGDLEAAAARLAETSARLLDPAVQLESEVTHPFGGRVGATGQDGSAQYRALSNHAIGAPHAITELRIVARDGDPSDGADLEQLLRRTLLIISFDEVETVRVPLGDFFGSAPGHNPYTSFTLSVDEQGLFTSRFLMPYKERLFVRVQATADEPLEVLGYVTLSPYEWTPNSLYFHSVWRDGGALSARPRRDWNVLTVEGRGVFVGDALSIGNRVRSWWGEGDEKIYVDGEPSPSHFGTGTGDYYGFAAGAAQPFQAPFHNLTRRDGPGHFGYTSLNRTRALDAIPFFARFEFDLEVWQLAEAARASFAATTWFYAELDALVERGDLEQAAGAGVAALVYRRPGAIEAEDLQLTAHSPGLELGPEDHGQSCSGARQLRVQATEPGQFVELRVPTDEAERRRVVVFATRGPDHGTLAFSIDGKPAGAPLVTFDGGDGGAEGDNGDPDAALEPQAHVLGEFDLPAGGFTLRVEVVGSHPDSRAPHHVFGLDCVLLEEPGS